MSINKGIALNRTGDITDRQLMSIVLSKKFDHIHTQGNAIQRTIVNYPRENLAEQKNVIDQNRFINRGITDRLDSRVLFADKLGRYVLTGACHGKRLLRVNEDQTILKLSDSYDQPCEEKWMQFSILPPIIGLPYSVY